jgi:hypothetical protein
VKRVLLLVCCALLSWNACAVEVEGVQLSDRLHIGDHDLVLNGAGVRSKFFFGMYVAALYVTEKTGSRDVILSGATGNRMAMHMLRDVSSEELSRSFFHSMKLNLTPAEQTGLEGQFKQLSELFAMMSEARKGDVITLDFSPAEGTAVNFNDVTIGRIEGAAFNAALLKVWLGDKPVQENLKKKLLGKR